MLIETCMIESAVKELRKKGWYLRKDLASNGEIVVTVRCPPLKIFITVTKDILDSVYDTYIADTDLPSMLNYYDLLLYVIACKELHNDKG